MPPENSVAPKSRISLSLSLPYGDAESRVELPLKILVMGDFTLRRDDRLLEERMPIEVDRARFDRVLAEHRITLDLVVVDARAPTPAAGRPVRLPLSRLDDFTPEGVARQAPELSPSEIDEVVHHAQFRELERAWRSLRYLVDHVDTGENIKVEVLHCSKDDLALDFDDAPDLPRSGLYKSVYGPAFDFSGQPYGLIVGDYTFDASPQDLSLLEKVASIAAMAHAPFVAAAAPSMFGLDAWAELPRVDDLTGLFEAPTYEAWRRFRDGDDVRYVALTLPRFMLRPPHALPAQTFAPESDGVSHHARSLWGNAAFALAARVAGSFAKYRWCPNIIGSLDGAVEDLPYVRREVDGRCGPLPPTECPLTERREWALSEAGFIGLMFRENAEQTCFLSANSVQRARYYGPSPEGRAAETTFRLGAQLPYLLMVSRVAHYLKVMTRQHVGVWMERRDIEYGLNAWLHQHAADVDAPAPAPRGPCIFRRAVVEVVDVEGQPAWYRFHLRVRPMFKSMGATFELSLVGKIDKI